MQRRKTLMHWLFGEKLERGRKMINERLQKLREKMKKMGISIYIVPSSDYHGSEYVCPYFRAREYITGFTGSAGTAVITQTEAGLWTDGRYFLQAEQQLKASDIQLFRMGEPEVPSIEDYVAEKLEAGGKIGFDGRVLDVFWAEAFEKIAEKAGGSLRIEYDFIGEIWEHRPLIPKSPVFILSESYAGASTKEKQEKVRSDMQKMGADVYVLASLCDIAWLLNLRGGDIPSVPVTLAFLILTKESCIYYVRSEVLTEEVRDYLSENNVLVKDYEAIYQDLEGFTEKKILLDKRNINYRLWKSIPEQAEIINQKNPTERFKAVKNETEIANLKQAHLKESIAFTKFLYWIKTRVGKEEITELQAAQYLQERRKEQEHYLEESFAPICAYGAHGAIVHYAATKESNAVILPENFLLVDSGGHYLEGTTDTTRTIALGTISEEQKRMFTAVCRGNLNLAYAKFLKGCTGLNLDILCREPLWQLEVDYKHGTGHGVGYLLNVHEGPNAFRWKQPKGELASELEAGMVTSDEPGIYIEGAYGIRIENELLCVEGVQNSYGQFLEFEILTWIPIDLDAILPEEMTEKEKSYLNNYHKKVYETIAPYLSEKEQIWLAWATREIK